MRIVCTAGSYVRMSVLCVDRTLLPLISQGTANAFCAPLSIESRVSMNDSALLHVTDNNMAWIYSTSIWSLTDRPGGDEHVYASCMVSIYTIDSVQLTIILCNVSRSWHSTTCPLIMSDIIGENVEHRCHLVMHMH